ncbi:MAG TPA: response regulator transcription factor [Steroidobacteraceae bacterium]|nr:response regulator transcription factor [Steroidobacteraceae bacterium]
MRAVPRDTVLVVDDTPEALGLLTDMLDGAGYTVLIATDGDSALRLVDQITPDLVLLDALMPGLDGFETCRRLKQKASLTHLPVIFMTGLAESEHVVHGLAAGGVDYVTKPIVVEELLARMRVHLTNARVAVGPNAALDASGRFLLATDLAGRIKWCTPKARTLLREFWPADAAEVPALPDSLLERMLALRHEVGTSCLLEVGGVQLECAMLSPIGPDELLFRLSEKRGGDDIPLLQQLGLTVREAEVLLWLSRGKANRQIGQILGISPRTVNKHLEQVFVKLGVENRASAATRAVRLLTR